MTVSEQQKRTIALVLGGVIFCALGWRLAVEPVKVKLFSARAQAQSARERSQIILEIHGFQKQLKELESSLRLLKEKHLVLGDVSTLANANHVEIQSMTPTPAPQENYTRLDLAIKAKSSFKALLDFLLAVEESKSNITVSGISLVGSQTYGYDGSEGVVQMPSAEITLTTYLKKG